MKQEFGFLRETEEDAKRTQKNYSDGRIFTGLEKYLKVIFPEVDDWVHDRPLGELDDGSYCRKRPDYLSKSLKMIVEFDGLLHYTSPVNIINDENNTSLYSSLGYKVIRIPYFIQLTREAVMKIFGVDVGVELFNKNFPSLGIEYLNTPAFLCSEGIKRMAREFKEFPEQYEVNLKNLATIDERLSGSLQLMEEYVKIEEK